MYQKYLLLLALMVSLGTSCNSVSDKTECEKLIDRRTMSNILTDVFLLEAKLTNQAPDSGIRDSVVNYYAGVFEKHNITTAQFEQAYECYLLDTENMNWIMDEVLTALSLTQSKIDEKKKEEELKELDQNDIVR
ncbi:MAG: DUF4296 domain-containing protein [Bacteroidota bacterium]